MHFNYANHSDWVLVLQLYVYAKPTSTLYVYLKVSSMDLKPFGQEDLGTILLRMLPPKWQNKYNKSIDLSIYDLGDLNNIIDKLESIEYLWQELLKQTSKTRMQILNIFRKY